MADEQQEQRLVIMENGGKADIDQGPLDLKIDVKRQQDAQKAREENYVFAEAQKPLAGQQGGIDFDHPPAADGKHGDAFYDKQAPGPADQGGEFQDAVNAEPERLAIMPPHNQHAVYGVFENLDGVAPAALIDQAEPAAEEADVFVFRRLFSVQCGADANIANTRVNPNVIPPYPPTSLQRRALGFPNGVPLTNRVSAEPFFVQSHCYLDEILLCSDLSRHAGAIQHFQPADQPTNGARYVSNSLLPLVDSNGVLTGEALYLQSNSAAVEFVLVKQRSTKMLLTSEFRIVVLLPKGAKQHHTDVEVMLWPKKELVQRMTARTLRTKRR
eukprot:TRINITY_DN3849_c0_g2_i1.p1 TRINITY_DN3849_c0_g2~~TRINITY_DN3849_c0_g2_i1.p1  ORF type:complete len:328 (+),score=89.30 TRINITY_DN3849_c0_g2_i1:93-1076(+)